MLNFKNIKAGNFPFFCFDPLRLKCLTEKTQWEVGEPSRHVCKGGWYHTHIDFSVYDVNETAKHNDEIKHIPRITKVILSRKQPMKKKKKHKSLIALHVMKGQEKKCNHL